MNIQYYLANLYLGKVTKCYGIETSIDKQPIGENIYLSEEGLVGDECADKKHHGGAERALHQYPPEHYDFWREKYGHQRKWQAPGMGENISIIGMNENNVYIGDRYQWGKAIVEVSQPRSPCYKLNKRWGVADIAKEMQDNTRCGWLYRVIQSGIVSVNKPLILICRQKNAMTVREVNDLFFGDPLNHEKLLTLKQQSKLSISWQEKITQRLASKSVENWHFRLWGNKET